jgi:hypothetical protein
MNKKMKNKKNEPVEEPEKDAPVKVKVFRHVPNKLLLQVHIPTGDVGVMNVGLMRVRDSRYYRCGEMISARMGMDNIWEPVGMRFRPKVGV